MRRSPEFRRLVLRGYLNLAAIIVGSVLLVLPIILDHHTVHGIQVTLTASAVIATGLALVQRFITNEWTTLFSGTVILGAMIVFMTGRFITSTPIKDIGLLLALGIIFFVLPRIAEHEQTHRK
jgi:hypothetical protein